MKNAFLTLTAVMLVFGSGFVQAAEELPVEMDAEILVKEPEANPEATLESAEKEIKAYCKQQKLSRKDKKEAVKTLKELVEKEIPVETAASMVSQAISEKDVEKICEDAKKLADVVENCEGKEKEKLKNAIGKAVEKGVPVGVVRDLAEGKIYQKGLADEKIRGKAKGLDEEKGRISPADVSKAVNVLSELVEKGIPAENAKDIVETALENGKDVKDIAKNADKIKEEIRKEKEVEKEQPGENLKETVTSDKMKEAEEEEINMTDEEKQTIENTIKEKEQELNSQIDGSDSSQYPGRGGYGQ